MNDKKTFWNLVKENKRSVIWLTILSSLLSLLLVIFAYVSKLLVDSIKDSSKDRFIVLACILVGLILVEVVLHLSLNMFYAKKSFQLEDKIRKETLFSYLQNDYLVLDNKDSSKWLNRILSDSKVVARAVITYLPELISLVTRIIASFIALVLIDYYFALALLILGVLSFFLSIGLRKKSKELHRISQNEEDNNLAFYKNTIYHSSLLRLFHSEEKIEKQCNEVQKKYYIARKRFADFSIYINTGFTFVMRLSYLGAIIYASIRIANSSSLVGYGSLIAMIQLIGQIEAPFTSLSGLLPKYYSALSSLERMNEYSANKKEINEAVYSSLLPIQVNDVAFGYSEDKTLFQHLSFEIKPNTITLIKSPSGSGKTTLIKVLMGMYPPKEGQVTYGDKDVSKCSSLFAYVPQNNYLIHDTLRNNLTLFHNGEISDERINEALSTVVLNEKISSLKNGLSTVLSDEGNGFSVGEGQRLNIARALLSDRPILVLDEATSALDKETEEILLTNLAKLNKTIVAISHKNQTETWADTILNLSDYYE